MIGLAEVEATVAWLPLDKRRTPPHPERPSAAGSTTSDPALDSLSSIQQLANDYLAALAAYKGRQTEQTGASGTRLDRDSLLKQATAGRMWIQFAADAEWPHTDPANHPIRREFQLPATTPYITAMKPPITPGETFLEEYLRPMRISQNAMARAIGGPPRTVNEIVLGKRAITPAMSIRFGAFFGQSDTFWHGSQGEYNFRSLARKRKQLVSGNPPATST